MNPTTEAAKAITKEQTRQLNLAMEFIPEEKRRWKAGGCAKTPMDIYLECVVTYLWAAKLLRGESVDWAQLARKAQEFSDFEKAKALAEQWQQEFFSAMDEVSQSRLEDKIDPGWGEKMPLGQFLFLPSYHVCYHCGQLNYVQTLLGDGEMHF